MWKNWFGDSPSELSYPFWQTALLPLHLQYRVHCSQTVADDSIMFSITHPWSEPRMRMYSLQEVLIIYILPCGGIGNRSSWAIVDPPTHGVHTWHACRVHCLVFFALNMNETGVKTALVVKFGSHFFVYNQIKKKETIFSHIDFSVDMNLHCTPSTLYNYVHYMKYVYHTKYVLKNDWILKIFEKGNKQEKL